MSKENKRRATHTANDDFDMGVEDIVSFFNNVSRHVEAPTPAPEPKAPLTPPPASAKKKKTLLTRKQGIYLSEKLDERLDKEWRNQKRGTRKSKSFIVENILRAHWKLPLLRGIDK